MLRHCTGVVCVPLLPDRADALELPLMVPANRDPFHTAFTVTVDCVVGTTTGISASDRAATIRALATSASPGDFSRPGHVFPLVARKGGVLERDGHTEAGVDLCRLAGLPPVSFLCEICDHESFEMLRLPEIVPLAARLRLPLTSIAELQRFRMRREPLLRRLNPAVVTTASLPLVLSYQCLYGARDNAYVVSVGAAVSRSPVGAVPMVVLFHAATSSTGVELEAAASRCVDDVSGAASVVVHVFGPVSSNVPGKPKAHEKATPLVDDRDVMAHSDLYLPPSNISVAGYDASLAARVSRSDAKAGQLLYAPVSICDRVAAEIMQVLGAALAAYRGPRDEPQAPGLEFTQSMFGGSAVPTPGIENIAAGALSTPEAELIEAHAVAWPRITLSVFVPEACRDICERGECTSLVVGSAPPVPRLWLFGAHVDAIDTSIL